MAPELGERARRRRGQQRRRLRLMAAGGGALLVIVVAVGAFALVGGGDKPAERIAQRRATTTSSSSTTTSSTVTTIVPRSTNPTVALAQQYDGYYEGTFTNQTHGGTGKVSLELRIDPNAGTLDVTSVIDGDLFGGGAESKTRTLEAQVTLGDPTAPVVTSTEQFGEVSARLDTNLQLLLSAADIPEPKVQSFEMVGKIRADHFGFDATFTVTYEGGGSAQGVMTVTCAATGQRPSQVPTLCSPPT